MSASRYDARRLAAALVLALIVGLMPHAAGAQDEPCVALGRDVVIAASEVNNCALILFNGNLRVEQSATQRGSIAMTGGDLAVEQGAVVRGDIAVTAGDVDLAGKVEGDVYSTGDVILRSSADISGDVWAPLGEVTHEAGAKVYGTVGGRRGGGDTDARPRLRGSVSKAISALSLVVFSVLFAALAMVVAPGAVGNVRLALGRRRVASIGVGLLAALLFPILFVVLLPSLVGPLLLLLIYLAGIAIGAVSLGGMLGNRLWPGGSGPASSALGTGILALILSVGFAGGFRLFCASFLIGGAVSVWLLGAALLTVFGVRRWPRAADGPAADGARPPLSSPNAEAELPMADIQSTDLSTEIPAATGVESSPPEPDTGTPVDRVEPDTPDEPAPLYSGGLSGTAVADSEISFADESVVRKIVAVAEDASAASTDESVGSDFVTPAQDVAFAGAEEPAVLDLAAEAADSRLPAGDEPEDEGADAGPTPGWGWEPPAEVLVAEETVKGTSAVPSDPVGPATDIDLQHIPGITPIFRQLLQEAGIRSAVDLAESTPETITQIISLPGVVPVGHETALSWIDRARKLAGS